MKKETIQLKEDADMAKYKFAVGEITYEEAMVAVKKYIDHANVIAKRIAKEHGMRPRFMSVKSYMR